MRAMRRVIEAASLPRVKISVLPQTYAKWLSQSFRPWSIRRRRIPRVDFAGLADAENFVIVRAFRVLWMLPGRNFVNDDGSICCNCTDLKLQKSHHWQVKVWNFLENATKVCMNIPVYLSYQSKHLL